MNTTSNVHPELERKPITLQVIEKLEKVAEQIRAAEKKQKELVEKAEEDSE